MNRVTLAKEGSIILTGKSQETAALKLLGFQIALEDGYRLRSYFEMLEKYTVLTKLNEFLPTYQEQYRANPGGARGGEDIDYLEFGKTIEMIGYPEKRLEIFNTLLGVSGNARQEITDRQIESLLDLSLKLGKLKHRVFGDSLDEFEFETVITLFEFIDGVAWQLSFHATPQQCEIRR
ncbi:MAG: hypothetical protein H8D61_02640 [Deltaproteobacteria bacterium]|nr:hypothetical protein [Deltaproteobacteria bacterium]